MTVSSSSTKEFTVAEIIKTAMQVAAIIPVGADPTAEESAFGRTLLDMELDYMQAEGIILRTVVRKTLALSSGTTSYSLPAEVFNIARDSAVISENGEDSDRYLEVIDLKEYQGLSSKSQTGVPTAVYVERQATVNLVFWPQPSESLVFSYGAIVNLADAGNEANTVDLSPRWIKPLTYTLAAQLAQSSSMPVATVQTLTRQAEKFMEIARMEDSPPLDGRFIARGRGHR